MGSGRGARRTSRVEALGGVLLGALALDLVDHLAVRLEVARVREQQGTAGVRVSSPYISHLSPSTMSCMASVQPAMTWFGAKVVGDPRS